MSRRVPLTTNARHASLAECQAGAIGPVPVALAIHIVLDLAQTLHAAHDVAERMGLPAHHGISATNVRISANGAITLDESSGGESPAEAAYHAPEQVSGGVLDRRSDVFLLGVLMWEMLAGTPLFDRPTGAATSAAILEAPIADVRSANPDVPTLVAEVLAAALVRDRQARFENVMALGRALAGARVSSNVAQPTALDLARWVGERVPRLAGPTPVAVAAAPDDVPDLVLPGSSRAAKAMTPPASAVAPQAPTSVRTAAAAAFGEISLAAPSQKSIAFDTGDDDDFDMQIERNFSTSVVPPQPSASRPSRPSRPSMSGVDRPLGPHSRPSFPNRASSGLELGAPQRLTARSERNVSSAEAGLGSRILGFFVALLVLGGTAFALLHFVHRAGGRLVTSALPHAFDGTSANESGAIALVSFVVAVTVIFVGLRLRPHAWSIVAAGGALLLLALAMVTVTLASTGENPTPPDGVLLVPYIAPVALLLLALGMGLRAARIVGRAYGARRLGGVPLAAIAGGLAFVAFEISRLAAR